MRRIWRRPPTANDPRRLRRKGFIERVEGGNLYRVSPYGRSLAAFLTKIHVRIVVSPVRAREENYLPAQPTEVRLLPPTIQRRFR